ncbi:hypothetical protein [Pseudomonas sp. 31 R 17]|uniref:hypothetical protein n=1 Tax=Pseudomonas sp. 31 R 17 TaxID=1844101 RepID=UPI00081200E0|nr:hypothetical protein [Pseudomonas sp. 31 R 17]CRM19867.1 hypothetical protein [Pseudomonas sp. 31 R 17]
MSFCIAISDVDWAQTKDLVSVVGAGITALGVIVASYVGVNGLATWRKQIGGQNDHELSRRMLIELYKFKQVFSNSRTPSVYPYEVQQVGDPAFNHSVIDRFKRQQLGFYRRIKAINLEYATLSVSMFEAEALWGREVVKYIRNLELLKDEFEDYVALKLLTIDPDESEEDRQDQKEFLDARRTVFIKRLEGRDLFGDDLDNVSEKLEQLLKSKLIR